MSLKFEKNTSHSGLSLLEVLVSVGFLGIFVLVSTKLVVLYNNTELAAEIMGEKEDLRRYVRSSASCQATYQAEESRCLLGQYVNLRDAAGNIIVRENFAKSVTKVGRNAALRARCSQESGVYAIAVEYALIKANATEVGPSTLQNNPLTGRPQNWADLFSVPALVCKAAKKDLLGTYTLSIQGYANGSWPTSGNPNAWHPNYSLNMTISDAPGNDLNVVVDGVPFSPARFDPLTDQIIFTNTFIHHPGDPNSVQIYTGKMQPNKKTLNGTWLDNRISITNQCGPAHARIPCLFGVTAGWSAVRN